MNNDTVFRTGLGLLTVWRYVSPYYKTTQGRYVIGRPWSEASSRSEHPAILYHEVLCTIEIQSTECYEWPCSVELKLLHRIGPVYSQISFYRQDPSIQCLVYCYQCRVYSVQCTVYSVHCTLYTVQRLLYSVHCVMHSELFTVNIVQCTV